MSNRGKLSVMMLLNIAVWGAWFPLVTLYMGRLGFNPEWQQPLIMNAFNVAAITAMFIFTPFADRRFSAEKFLAFSMLVSGLALIGLTWVTEFWVFFALMLTYSLFFVPTISITNSIAFANLRDPENDFGKVRLWGTIGWIAVAWPFVFILVDWSKVPALAESGLFDWLGNVLKSENAKQGDEFLSGASNVFLVGGILSIILAGFSLLLPHTPPKPPTDDSEQFAWLEALKLLRVPFLLILFIVTFFDAGVHQFFFFMTGKYLVGQVGIPENWVMPVMSIGQIAEIGTMAFLGLVLKRLGWRTTMVIGILGHTARFTVFAFFPEAWAAIAINLVHGICYAFFFATVYIFVDAYFPTNVRSSAQGLFNLLILGLGPIAGNIAAGQLESMYTVNSVTDYQSLFLVPAAISFGAAVFLLLFFHPPARTDADVDEAIGDPIAPAPMPSGVVE